MSKKSAPKYVIPVKKVPVDFDTFKDICFANLRNEIAHTPDRNTRIKVLKETLHWLGDHKSTFEGDTYELSKQSRKFLKAVTPPDAVPVPEEKKRTDVYLACEPRPAEKVLLPPRGADASGGAEGLPPIVPGGGGTGDGGGEASPSSPEGGQEAAGGTEQLEALARAAGTSSNVKISANLQTAHSIWPIIRGRNPPLDYQPQPDPDADPKGKGKGKAKAKPKPKPKPKAKADARTGTPSTQTGGVSTMSPTYFSRPVTTLGNTWEGLTTAPRAAFTPYSHEGRYAEDTLATVPVPPLPPGSRGRDAWTSRPNSAFTLSPPYSRVQTPGQVARSRVLNPNINWRMLGPGWQYKGGVGGGPFTPDGTPIYTPGSHGDGVKRPKTSYMSTSGRTSTFMGRPGTSISGVGVSGMRTETPMAMFRGLDGAPIPGEQTPAAGGGGLGTPTPTPGARMSAMSEMAAGGRAMTSQGMRSPWDPVGEIDPRLHEVEHNGMARWVTEMNRKLVAKRVRRSTEEALREWESSSANIENEATWRLHSSRWLREVMRQRRLQPHSNADRDPQEEWDEHLEGVKAAERQRLEAEDRERRGVTGSEDGSDDEEDGKKKKKEPPEVIPPMKTVDISDPTDFRAAREREQKAKMEANEEEATRKRRMNEWFSEPMRLPTEVKQIRKIYRDSLMINPLKPVEIAAPDETDIDSWVHVSSAPAAMFDSLQGDRGFARELAFCELRKGWDTNMKPLRDAFGGDNTKPVGWLHKPLRGKKLQEQVAKEEAEKLARAPPKLEPGELNSSLQCMFEIRRKQLLEAEKVKDLLGYLPMPTEDYALPRLEFNENVMLPFGPPRLLINPLYEPPNKKKKKGKKGKKK
uniref:Uncharacterized protein n=1 Tax=Chromera velia CCMP2878 TaxID=1169474 RepID=A0A0G4FBT2_9ALVE|eukprot:Cvel_16082.t1-p1 / transcript=Cvel_16082.t1 / gene=Cvel_16082 / organism=Chromera_velia_CCMP2878 / gene_product=hypothetical protein / transcript_product=hypothetical protein / location=Cvel_scaffold1222:35934-42364(+) / protein_length=860 / sequence_SO=supercontig / SO=protein_coding / is_pseudo=false